MFKGINQEEFYAKFQCEDDCNEYLFSLKWKKGYMCKRCGHKKSWKGKTAFHVRCQKCGYDESVTANTIFHKLKIPLKKAFGLAFEMAISKKGKSSNDLRKTFKVNAKTAYNFRKKAHKAIEMGVEKDSVESEDVGLVIDGITVMKREKGLNGFQRIGVELKKSVSQKHRNITFIRPVHFLTAEGEIDFSRLIGGKFKEPKARILLWNFKVWLTGVHHHCSVTYLQGYLNEFFFRYSYRHRTEEIWHQLIERFMLTSLSKIDNNAA